MKYTDELDKVSYSLGLSIASNLISSGVTTINAEAFIDGLNVVFSGKMLLFSIHLSAETNRQNSR